MEPDTQTNTNLSQSKKMIIAVVIILAVIILGLILVVTSNQTSDQTDTTDVDTPAFIPGTESSVTTVDLSAATTDEDKLPSGFPTDLPLDYGNITESLTTSYADTNTTELSVVFNSPKSYADLKSEFETYFEDGGYDFTVNELQSDAVAQIRGTNSASGEALSVTLQRTSDSSVSVQTSYTK